MEWKFRELSELRKSDKSLKRDFMTHEHFNVLIETCSLIFKISKLDQ